MPESADPNKANQDSPRRPPPEVEKLWRERLGDEEFEIRVRRIQGAKPLFNDEAADTDSGDSPPSDEGIQSPPPRKPPGTGSSGSDGGGPDPRKVRRYAPRLVSFVASVLCVLATVLLAGAIADLVGDPTLTIAERTSGTVAVLSALIGIIATCASAAFLTLKALAGEPATHAASIVLGAGLLLLGVSGGVSIAASIDDTCDSQCSIRDITPSPVETPNPRPESDEPET